jgi:hypothetical protein
LLGMDLELIYADKFCLCSCIDLFLYCTWGVGRRREIKPCTFQNLIEPFSPTVKGHEISLKRAGVEGVHFEGEVWKVNVDS